MSFWAHLNISMNRMKGYKPFENYSWRDINSRSSKKNCHKQILHWSWSIKICTNVECHFLEWSFRVGQFATPSGKRAVNLANVFLERAMIVRKSTRRVIELFLLKSKPLISSHLTAARKPMTFRNCNAQTIRSGGYCDQVVQNFPRMCSTVGSAAAWPVKDQYKAGTARLIMTAAKLVFSIESTRVKSPLALTARLGRR